MSVAINLPPDMEIAVRHQAEISGQDVTAFVLQAVREKVEGRVDLKAPARVSATMATGPDLDPNAGVEKKFLALTAVWRYDVGPASSVTQMVAHPAYLQIIGLGRAVLPYLFRELARQPDHWSPALAAITGEDPVPPDAEGELHEMS